MDVFLNKLIMLGGQAWHRFLSTHRKESKGKPGSKVYML